MLCLLRLDKSKAHNFLFQRDSLTAFQQLLPIQFKWCSINYELMLHLTTNIFEMTSPTSITEMAFIPHDLVTIQVGCLSTNVYPKVKVVSGMPNFECAHAFQVIKSALDPLSITTCLILDAIGLQLNCSAIVKGLIFDWKNAFDTHWFNFANLVILSFHNLVSTIIANTPLKTQ
jgi:hypothetical protein